MALKLSARPADHSARRPFAPAARVDSNTHGASMRVLLVEDSAADARLVRELIQDSGAGDVTVTHVTRVREALARLGDDGFDAILLDLTLPDARGIEGLHQLVQAAPDI